MSAEGRLRRAPAVLVAVACVLAVGAPLLVLPVGSVAAAPTSVAGCTIIDAPGEYALTGDIDDGSFGACIRIQSSDVVLDGNGYTLNNTGSNRDGIQVSGQYDGGTNVTIQNVTLTNWNRALYFQSDPDVTVSNVRVDGAKTGLDATGTVDVSASEFVNVTSTGISAPQDSDTTIRNVTVVSERDGVSVGGTLLLEDSDISAGAIKTGVSITDVSSYASPFDVTVRNNTIRGGYRVLSISRGVDATVVDNTLVGDGDADGVVLDYGTQAGDGPVTALIDGNDIVDVENGVAVQVDNRTQSLADVTVTNNAISNVTTGVVVNEDEDSTFQPWVANARVTYDIGDNIFENATRGVYVWGTGEPGTVTGNRIDIRAESGTAGVILSRSNATLSGNDVTSASEEGSGVRIWNAPNVAIDGDHYHDARRGIFTYNSSVVATDVVVQNVSSSAIFVRNSTVHLEGGSVSETPTAYESGLLSDEWADVTVSGATVTGVEQAAEFDYGDLVVTDTDIIVAANATRETFDIDGANVTLDGVVVENEGENDIPTAVYGWGGANVTVANSAIDDAATGVLLADSDGTVVTTTIRNASVHAINATNASIAVADNEIYNASDDYLGAIALTNASGSVVGNSIESNWYGIESTDSSAVIDGNNISSVLYGVDYTDSTGPILNNSLDGGLYLSGVQYGEPTEMLVAGNEITVDGFRTGVSVVWNVRADVRDNDITADRVGVRAHMTTGATVSGNTITIRESDRDDSAGVGIRESTSISRPDEIEPIRILGNEFTGDTGVRIGDQYSDVVHPDRTITIVGNDVSATEVAFHNRNATAIDVPLNYYGPRGPTHHEFVGPLETVEPFLTAPSDGSGDPHAYLDAQTFGYALDMPAGRMYAVGTPARLEGTLSETFGAFDGAVYLYDEPTQSWTLATGDEVLGPMDAVVVVPETDARAVVDFADATPARPAERQVSEGWNFVAPRHYGNAEDAFSTGTTSLTDLIDVYTHPAGQPTAPGVDFGGRYAFAEEATGPRVSPFAGYFVYASGDGTIPGTVPTGVTFENVVQLLEQAN